MDGLRYELVKPTRAMSISTQLLLLLLLCMHGPLNVFFVEALRLHPSDGFASRERLPVGKLLFFVALLGPMWRDPAFDHVELTVGTTTDGLVVSSLPATELDGGTSSDTHRRSVATRRSQGDDSRVGWVDLVRTFGEGIGSSFQYCRKKRSFWPIEDVSVFLA